MIEQFKQWEKNRHDYAKQWKEDNGGKVMGYFCTYVPEEILYAAGVLPVRILYRTSYLCHVLPILSRLPCPGTQKQI